MYVWLFYILYNDSYLCLNNFLAVYIVVLYLKKKKLPWFVGVNFLKGVQPPVTGFNCIYHHEWADQKLAVFASKKGVPNKARHFNKSKLLINAPLFR